MYGYSKFVSCAFLSASILILVLFFTVCSTEVKATETTTARYIRAVTSTRLLRVQQTDHLRKVQNFTLDIQSDLANAKAQHMAILMSHRLAGVTQTSFEKAKTRALQKLQFLTNTQKESEVIRFSSELRMKEKLKLAKQNLFGIERWMNSSNIPLMIEDDNLFNTSISSIDIKVGGTSINSTSTGEGYFMCTGDYFGLFIDPQSLTLHSFGEQSLGRTVANIATPMPVDLTLSDGEYIKMLACGGAHALVLTNMAIYSWGSNIYGQVGIGVNSTSVDLPMKITSHNNTIRFIAAGNTNSIYLDRTGTVKTWGKGLDCHYSELGVTYTNTTNSTKGEYNTSSIPEPVTNQYSPTSIPESVTDQYSPTSIPGSVPFKKVCLGAQHVVGQSMSGNMYYWGISGSVPSTECYPTQFTSSFFQEEQANIADFHCGDYTTLILLKDGRLFGFGSNEKGELGTGYTHSSYTDPVQSKIPDVKIDKIHHRGQHVIALGNDSNIYTWGRNDDKVCQCATGLSNTDYCDIYAKCRRGCGPVLYPTLAKLPSLTEVDNILDMYVMRKASLIVYSKQNTIRIMVGGKFSVPYFSNNMNMILDTNSFNQVYSFNFYYIPPVERKFPIYENSTHKIVIGENYFISLSIENRVIYMVNKERKEISADNYIPSFSLDAYQFSNTHDFSIDGLTYYFGGLVNNSISERIISFDTNGSMVIYNQTLPYPVCGGVISMVEDYIYIFGGLTIDRGNIIPTRLVMRASISNILEWKDFKQYLPRPLYNSVLHIQDETIYIFGGRTSSISQSSDILRASTDDLVWKNDYQIVPLPCSESSIFSDKNFVYIAGGFNSSLQFRNVLRASKKDLLTSWEVLPVQFPIEGISQSYVHNSELFYYALDFTKNYQKSLPNISLSIHSFHFQGRHAQKTNVIDGAVIFGGGLTSCLEYKNVLHATSGLYWIRPKDSVYIVYCEQEVNEGGWILVSSRSNQFNPKIMSIVKPDYQGGSLRDERWAEIYQQSSELMWKDENQVFMSVGMGHLQKSKCKSLSKESLRDTILYHDQENENGCAISGHDYCILGMGFGRSAEIYSYCSNLFENSQGKQFTQGKANIYVR